MFNYSHEYKYVPFQSCVMDYCPYNPNYTHEVAEVLFQNLLPVLYMTAKSERPAQNANA